MGDVMFKKLAKQLKAENDANSSFSMSSPMEAMQEQAKKTFLKRLSKHALNLYERKTDINNFTKLVLSDPENKSHEDIVDKLFNKGVVDPFSEDAIFNLSDNERFLRDLGLK